MFNAKIKPVANRLLDIIYPPRCIMCMGNVHENGNICATCWGDVNFISDPQCELCGFPFDFDTQIELICAGCMKEKPRFAKARAVFLYDDASRKMITSFKYNDRTENRTAYARWMARVGADMLKDADILVPVPIHFGKLFLRKYNQAGILAQELVKISGGRCILNALIRKRYTKTQAGFNRNLRFKNIKGAFAVNQKHLSKLQNKKILLIDDVITTGATAEECTKILLKAGVAKVEVLTLAKTLY